MAKALTVDAFITQLSHPRKDDIICLRQAILAGDTRIGEQIKWNAPSFVWNGDDRVTMLLKPADRLALVFHRGVKVKSSAGFSFDDPTGLIVWATPDRGALTLPADFPLAKRLPELVALVLAWMQQTS
jgi:hypothetical protein